MHTRLGSVAAQVAESSWLVALIAVPVLFNVHSVRIFDGDKIPLLRSIALCAAAALTALSLAEGRRVWNVAGRPLWQFPLVIPALLFAAVFLLSTLCSIAPRQSWWGSYERLQGLYTWLSYMTLFVAIATLVRSPAQRERIVAAALLASFPVAAYGVVQHFGADPLHWEGPLGRRAASTAGNPIFLGAYLIMVVPLTIAHGLEHLRRRRPPHSASLVAVADALLLLMQILAIVSSKSRGPLLGLAAGVASFVTLLAVHRGRRWPILALAGAAIGGMLTVALWGSPRSPRLTSFAQGSGKARVLVWQGAIQLLRAHPARDLVGYGPDTLYLAYAPFSPSKLAHLEEPDVAVDRAHNATFDALIMTGVAGAGVQLALFVSFFYWALWWLGVLQSSQRFGFFAALASGAALGVVIPSWLDKGLRFSGLGVPLGIVAGLLAYLVVRGARPSRSETPLPAVPSLLLIGLFSTVVAHFVELQLGIATGMTNLLFWVCIGLAVSIGAAAVHGNQSTIPSPSHAPEDGVPSAMPAAWGGLAGVALIILTFDFGTAPILPSLLGVPALLMAGTWLLGALFLDAGCAADARHTVGSQLRNYAVVSIGVWLMFVAVYAPWANWKPARPANVLQVITHTANAMTVLYIALLAGIALVAAALPHPPPRRSGREPIWGGVVGAVLALAAIAVNARINLDVSRADVFAERAAVYRKQKRFDAAQQAAEEALRLQPDNDRYVTSLVQTLMDLARSAGARHQEYLVPAVARLQQAQLASPWYTDHWHNEARVRRLQAEMSTDSADRSRQQSAADRCYAHAVALSPNNAVLRDEWAVLSLERDQPEQALSMLDESARIDDGYTTTYWVRGNLHMSAGRFEAALADFERALTINRRLLPGWSGKALALIRLNRLPEAIAATQQALQVKPDDFISRKNLALLYREDQQPDQALAAAEAALTVAPAAERPGLEEVISELRGQNNAK